MKSAYLVTFGIIAKTLKIFPPFAENVRCCAGKFLKFRISKTTILKKLKLTLFGEKFHEKELSIRKSFLGIKWKAENRRSYVCPELAHYIPLNYLCVCREIDFLYPCMQ